MTKPQIGELRITRYRDIETGSDKLHVDHADPVVLAHDETLREIFFSGAVAKGWLAPEPLREPHSPLVGFAEIERPEEGHGSSDGHFSKAKEYTECKTLPGMICFANNKLTIHGDDRTVIYIIREYLYESNQWLMAWPD
jgi:hypothetical protein